jgi:succinate dehydrogenase / fumarate reductase, cytochrome b subunit
VTSVPRTVAWRGAAATAVLEPKKSAKGSDDLRMVWLYTPVGMEATIAPVSSFIRARLGSLLAVVPLGVWTFAHVWNNLSAFGGAEAWEKSVTTYAHPVAQLATGLAVLTPLVLHVGWGASRLLTSRPNNLKYSTFANLKYALQRLSAIGVLLFLGAHLWLAMLRPRLVQNHPEPFADIAHEMRTHTPTLVVYVLGTLGTAYHLGNGLATFAMGWGVVSSKRGLRHANVVAWIAFVTLLLMSWAVIYALYRSG